MTVAIDTRSTADTVGSGASSDHNNLTVGTGSNRALLAMIGISDNAAGTISAAWDPAGANQALTQIVTATTPSVGTARTFLFGLVNPTAGNKTLRVSSTGTTFDIVVYAYSLTGADQTGGATTFPHSTSNTGTGSGAQGITITSAVGNFTFSDLVWTGGSANVTAHSQTQRYLESATSVINGAGQDGTGAATVSHTWTFTAADNWAIVGTDVAAVPSATNSGTGSASSTSSGTGIAAAVGVGTAGSPTTLYSRPYLNVSAGNWLGSSGSQLANDIDEPTASDTDYIYDANTGVDGEYRLEPIPDAGTQYGLILHYRPEARWWDATIVTTLLYGSTTIAQWTDSLTANAGATTLDKTLTVAEITAIRTASSNASIWTDLRLRHSATQ